ncbi:thymidylate kinase [Cephus cinctus]|uniref:Thymidylate kinase n=1 Tax=Cephus cinctus TaxID=211228 RepID=A0AAJ7RDR7_CEPCN|nr:thymidylate kinase [Cephus cinctus]
MKRGALLVLEGCDRAGKSTQVKKLVGALNDYGIPTEARVFPNRKTEIGQMISRVLTNKMELPLEAAYLLFSANRWECSKDIIDSLEAGITLVVDRYAASGAAYAAATTDLDISVCKTCDTGLPQPDAVFLLELSSETQVKRSKFGEEKFEREQIQKRVAQNFKELKDDSWTIIDANGDIETIHKTLLKEALKIVSAVNNNPIKQLYLK